MGYVEFVFVMGLLGGLKPRTNPTAEHAFQGQVENWSAIVRPPVMGNYRGQYDGRLPSGSANTGAVKPSLVAE